MEWKRLFGNFRLWLMLLAAVIAHIFFLGQTERQQWEEACNSYGVPAKEVRETYLERFDQYSGLEPENAWEEVQLRKMELESSSDWPLEDYIDVVYLAPVVEAEASYSSYRETIEENADSLSRFSIFQQENSFSSRNIEKTCKDYEALGNPTIMIGDWSVAELLLDDRVAGVLLILLEFYFVYSMLEERRNGMWKVLHSTSGGRGRLFAKRLAAAGMFGLLATCALYLSGGAFLCALYGVPDWTSPVQAVPGLQEFVLPMTLGRFALVFVGWRLAAGLACAMLMWLFMEVSGFLYFSLIMTVGGLALEYACFSWIPIQSRWNLLHYLNIVQGILSSEGIAEYINLNLFGYPVTCLTALLALYAGVIVLGAIVVCRSYQKKCPEDKSLLLLRLQAGLERGKDRAFEILPVWTMDLYKAWVLRLGFASLLVACLVPFYLHPSVKGYKGGYEYLVQKDREELEGQYNSLTVREWIEEEAAAIDETGERLAGIWETAEDEETDPGILLSAAMEEQALEVRQSAFEEMQQNLAELAELEGETGICPWIVEPAGWEQLIGKDSVLPSRYRLYALLCVLALAFLEGTVFTYEKESGVVRLIRGSRRGPQKFFARSQKILIFHCLAILGLVYLPDLWKVSSLYQLTAWNAPVQSLKWLRGISFPMTLATFVGIAFIIRFLTLLAMGEVLFYLSVRLSESGKALLIGSLLFGLPCLVTWSKWEGLLLFDPAYYMEARGFLIDVLTGEGNGYLALGMFILLLVIGAWSGLCAARRWNR